MWNMFRRKYSMKLTLRSLLPATLALLAVLPAFAGGKPQTLTGKVSDSMCGAKHVMAGKDADCARECVKRGANYSLVVGDKVYTLATTDKATLDKLSELAGSNAKVTGDVNGDSIAVQSVAK
jgi:hypothetical protein